MNKLKKNFSLAIAFAIIITAVPRFIILPNAAIVTAQSNTAGEKSAPSSWAEEISHNSEYAGIVSVPPVIRVANANYGLDNQALSASDCTTIQTQVINYSTRSMQSYNTGISITLPADASAPTLTAATQGSGLVTIVADNTGGNPYTWHIAGGTASAGNYINYTFTYNVNSRTYIQKAASYVDLVELAAGWQTYIVEKNWWNTTWTRHEYTATLSGSGSSGLGYSIYGGGGTGYYKMATGGGSTGFVSNSGSYSGMRLWDLGFDGKTYDVGNWYCGQSGSDSKDNGDAGYRSTLDIYYDPTVITNISQLGIKLLYWRSTSPSDLPTLYQERMIYLLGNSRFSSGSSSNGTAQSYFYSTNALNNRSQSISTSPGTMVFNFGSTALPADGQQVTFASSIYGKSGNECTSWDAWLITFHVVQKSALRALINTEDTAFRQVHDGYNNTDGSFTAYQAQLAKSKAVLNQPNATPAQISAAVNDLTAAKDNLKYVPADYTALNTLVNEVYNAALGYRPSPVNDPDYYYMTSDYYPSSYYVSTSELAAALASVEYGHDIRYQSYINTMATNINSTWRAIVLKNADYTTIDNYLDKIEGLNDTTGSEAGNYILANGTKYPQYASVMLYWKYFTNASYTNWENAVLGVTLGLKIPDQASVTSMSSALQNAYEGLTVKPADYSSLNAIRASALDAVGKKVYVQNPAGTGYELNYYDSTSVNAMQTILISITDDLLIPEQGTIYNWADSLQSLYNAKTVNKADYTFADAQKAALADYESSHAIYYTDSSWLMLINARNAVQNGKLANEQELVNTWAQNIYYARNALVYNSANYSAVNAAIAAANALNASDYKNWSSVQQALDAVVYGLDITKQATVDGFAANIYATFNNLVYTDANLTGLLEALAAASGKDESLYTPETWAALSRAVSEGIAIRDAAPPYNITKQEDVDAAALAIQNCLTGLIYKEADYSAVTAAIAAANALKASDYKNWNVVQEALDAVNPDLNITKQADVNSFADAIYAAINNLVYADANLTGLIDVLSSAASKDENLYTPETWAALSDVILEGLAIRDANPAYNITRQGDVDAAALAIQNCLRGLIYKEADYSAVTAAIVAANELNNSDYKNWSTVLAALDAVVPGLDITKQADVNGFADAIYAAISGLVYADADLAGLLDALSAAGAKDETLYTPETWAALTSAVSEGLAIRDANPAYNITKQGDVDNAVLSIQNCITGLVYKDADYSAVTAAIAAANALNSSNYKNWSSVLDALGAVVPGLDITKQAAVNSFADAIYAAISGLVYADADLTGLLDALSAAASKVESLYTPETWASLSRAVSEGSAICDADPAYNITKQADVDAAVLAISQAFEQLAEAVVKFEPSQGSGTIVDTERGFIFGLPANGSLSDLESQGFLEVIGNGHFVYTPTASGFGTGTKVELVRDGDGKVMATYTIVIFGDTDGDGQTSGNDACVASLIAAGMLNADDVSKAVFLAADANHDGVVNEQDSQLMELAGLFLAEIHQTI